MRPFLFMAGEFAVTQPIVFRREPWSHTMSARRLVQNEDGTIRRDNIFNEHLQGIIYFASVDSTEIRRANLKLLIDSGFPCWPDPKKLIMIDDRHVVMQECITNGFVDHPAFVVNHRDVIPLKFPYVLKTGNLHQGYGKHLITKIDEVPEWEGLATAEPFFDGVSARVLWIGDKWFGIRYDNPTSWIKNSAGADVALWPEIPLEAVSHSRKIHDHFGLEMSGIDYIIGKNGESHFLEYNQFPGVGVSDEISECAGRMFEQKMDSVEEMVKSRPNVVHEPISQ